MNADTVLNQESFDKLMGQLDRMTKNELYMIRHQAQIRLREMGMRAFFNYHQHLSKLSMSLGLCFQRFEKQKPLMLSLTNGLTKK